MKGRNKMRKDLPSFVLHLAGAALGLHRKQQYP